MSAQTQISRPASLSEAALYTVALGAGIAGLTCAMPANAQDQGAPDAASEAAQPANAPSFLVLLAHPDDEMMLAPALSRIAQSGGQVTVMFATSGDQGPGVSGLEPGAELAALRENEAKCSAFALGLSTPEFWRLGDGTLAKDAHLPGSTARTLVSRVDEAIRRISPKAVLTFGPDGATGHADHRMISAAATQVVQGMDTGRPDLLYLAIQGQSAPDLPGFEGWGWVNPQLVTDRIGYEPSDIDAAQNAAQCYESQFNQEVRSNLIQALNKQVWRGKVQLRLAFLPGF